MAVLDPAPFVQHVLLLGGGGIGTAVRSDIGSHRRKKISAGTGVLDGRAQASILVLVFLKDFAVSGEVCLFEGGGRESRFGIEESRKLGNERFSL